MCHVRHARPGGVSGACMSRGHARPSVIDMHEEMFLLDVDDSDIESGIEDGDIL
jgi:hypothetical protein